MEIKHPKIYIFLALLNSGGAQKILITLANSLKAKGYNVTLVAGHAKGAMKDLVDSHLEVIDLKSTNIRKNIFKLARLLRKDKPDILLSTQLHTNLVAVISTYLAGHKNQVFIREATTPSLAFEMAKNKKDRFLFRMARILFKRADKMIAVSEGVLSDLTQFYNVPPSKTVLCLNPVISADLFKKSKEEVDHPWIHQKFPILCTLGRIDPSKDLLTLINGFAMARKECIMKLLIIGGYDEESDYYRNLRSRIQELNISEDIEFIGFDINPYKWLEKADLFLFTTKIEGLPGALIQALALNCKIVTSQFRSGLKDVLDHGKFGKIFPQGDEKHLASLILESLNEPLTYTEDERIRQLNKFTFESAMIEYEKLLNTNLA